MKILKIKKNTYASLIHRKQRLMKGKILKWLKKYWKILKKIQIYQKTLKILTQKQKLTKEKKLTRSGLQYSPVFISTTRNQSYVLCFPSPLKGLRPQGRGDARAKIGFCGVCFVRVAREKQCAWPAGDLDALAQNDPIDSVPLPLLPRPSLLTFWLRVHSWRLVRDPVFPQDAPNKNIDTFLRDVKWGERDMLQGVFTLCVYDNYRCFSSSFQRVYKQHVT